MRITVGQFMSSRIKVLQSFVTNSFKLVAVIAM